MQKPHNKLKKSLLVIVFSCLLMNNACNNNAEEITETTPREPLPEGFHEFYDAFHTDSLFQFSHIVFPVTSMSISIDSSRADTIRESIPENRWKLHRPFVDNGEFQRTFQVIGDLVLEKITDRMGLYTIERRWGKLDSTWSLIYYGTIQKQW